MKASRALSAAAAALLLMSLPGHAQTVHRTNVAAGQATPTGASFSVEMPVPYDDVELRAEDPSNPTFTVRMVTGVTSDRVRFSASEMPYLAGSKPGPIEDFMNRLKDKPAVAEVADVHHERSAGRETLSFMLMDTAGGGNFFDVIRTDTAQYTLLVQFHHDQFARAATVKDGFFGSFKLPQP